MKMYKLLILLFALLISLNNCGDNNTDPWDENDVLLPLKIGNYWIHIRTLLNPDGSVSKVYIDTTTVVEIQKMNSLDVYHLLTNLDNNATFHQFFLNQPNGLCGISIKNEMYVPKLEFKYPAKQGETYMAYDGETFVISTNRSTEVPAGEFSCYVYEIKYIWEDHFSKAISHYAPNIGLVYSERWHSTDGTENNAYLWEYSVLIEYKVN